MAKLLLWELKKSLLFGELLKFFHLKSSLIPFLEEFKKSVNKDIFTHWLKSLDIAHITQQMKNITSLVKIIAWPLIKFRNVWIYIPDKARNVLERFISIEVSWLSDYIRAFRETLSTWIEVHKAELSAYQKSELLSKDEEIYLLASSRLSSHIENIEKVKMQL